MAVRLAFVGCGTIARLHLQAIQGGRHTAEVVAAVDISRDRAEEFVKLLPRPDKCRVFSSLSDALEYDDITAVVLMVPHDLHESLTVECLRAGKHVLLEKPLAHTLESCKRLLEVTEKSQPVCMVAENSQFWPEVVKAKELIDSGVIGEPYYARAHYWESTASAFQGDVIRDSTDWRFDKKRSGGGVLMDGATHWIRPLRMWFGEVKECIGTIAYPYKMDGVDPSQAVETQASALLRFQNDKTADIFCHYNDIHMHPLPFFQIFGEKGEITIDGSFGGGLTVRTPDHPTGEHMPSLGGYNGAFAPQMDVFLSAVVGGRGLEGMYGPRRCLGEVLVAHAVYKSLKSKKWEEPSLENVMEN